jgi:type IV pilus assembly protein PilE
MAGAQPYSPDLAARHASLVVPRRCGHDHAGAVSAQRAHWRAARGFTLVELLVACSVAAVLAAVALPGFQAQWRQAQRADAVAALLQLQQAQEQYRAHHGMYADTLPALQGVPQGISAQGHYRLVLQRLEGEVYSARAEALADSPQAGDTPCAVLTLRVNAGFAQPGPSARCWNR